MINVQEFGELCNKKCKCRILLSFFIGVEGWAATRCDQQKGGLALDLLGGCHGRIGSLAVARGLLLEAAGCAGVSQGGRICPPSAAVQRVWYRS